MSEPISKLDGLPDAAIYNGTSIIYCTLFFLRETAGTEKGTTHGVRHIICENLCKFALITRTALESPIHASV